MYQQDYIKRVIEELAAAIARLVGLRAEGKTEEAALEVQSAYAALEVNPHLVASLGGASLTLLLNSPEKVRGLAQLLEEESKLDLDSGRGRSAETKKRKAMDLLSSLVKMEAPPQ